jgi:hypothetical protein
VKTRNLAVKLPKSGTPSERERSKQPDQTDKRDLSPETRESLERSEPVMVSNTYGMNQTAVVIPPIKKKSRLPSCPNTLRLVIAKVCNSISNTDVSDQPLDIAQK